MNGYWQTRGAPAPDGDGVWYYSRFVPCIGLGIFRRVSLMRYTLQFTFGPRPLA